MTKHAATLITQLGKGWTIGEAVKKANEVVDVRGEGMRPIKMITKGDSYSRIIDAYTGSEVNKSWCYALD